MCTSFHTKRLLKREKGGPAVYSKRPYDTLCHKLYKLRVDFYNYNGLLNDLSTMESQAASCDTYEEAAACEM
jgi:hypothetical protein